MTKRTHCLGYATCEVQGPLRFVGVLPGGAVAACLSPSRHTTPSVSAHAVVAPLRPAWSCSVPASRPRGTNQGRPPVRASGPLPGAGLAYCLVIESRTWGRMVILDIHPAVANAIRSGINRRGALGALLGAIPFASLGAEQVDAARSQRQGKSGKQRAAKSEGRKRERPSPVLQGRRGRQVLGARRDPSRSRLHSLSTKIRAPHRPPPGRMCASRVAGRTKSRSPAVLAFRPTEH